MNIPEEAIEAAVKAWDHHWGDRYGDEAIDEMGEEVRVALNAAAPFIAAQALRDEAERLDRMPDSTNTSPYVRAGQHIIQQIRNRAAELESSNA